MILGLFEGTAAQVLLPRGPEMNEHKILKGKANERVGKNCEAILKS